MLMLQIDGECQSKCTVRASCNRGMNKYMFGKQRDKMVYITNVHYNYLWHDNTILLRILYCFADTTHMHMII